MMFLGVGWVFGIGVHWLTRMSETFYLIDIKNRARLNQQNILLAKSLEWNHVK